MRLLLDPPIACEHSSKRSFELWITKHDVELHFTRLFNKTKKYYHLSSTERPSVSPRPGATMIWYDIANECMNSHCGYALYLPQ
jgi:hypothetical protein